MCFRKKKEQIKEPQSVPANPKTPIARKMSLWGGKSFKEPVIDIPKELEYLKNNYYQNSFLKSSNEQKKPEPKIENPTSEKLEINTFQVKSDSILTDNKLSEIAEAGSVENNETPRLCMKKSEQLDKNAHFREEVVDSIRPLRANENVTKGEALALVTTVRSEYFQDTNKIGTKCGENQHGGFRHTTCLFKVVDYQNGDEDGVSNPDFSNELGPDS